MVFLNRQQYGRLPKIPPFTIRPRKTAIVALFLKKSCVYLQIPQTAGRSNPSVRIKIAHPNGQASETDRQKNFYRKLLSEARTPLFSLCRCKSLAGQRFQAADHPKKLFAKLTQIKTFAKFCAAPDGVDRAKPPRRFDPPLRIKTPRRPNRQHGPLKNETGTKERNCNALLCRFCTDVLFCVFGKPA